MKLPLLILALSLLLQSPVKSQDDATLRPALPQGDPSLRPVLAQENALTTLNNSFRATYAQTKRDILARTSPVMLVVDGKLVVLDGPHRKEYAYRPSQYDALKTVDHLPLAMYLLLRTRTGQHLDTETMNKLNAFSAMADGALKELPKASVPASLTPRQRRIAFMSAEFLQKVKKTNAVSANQLERFARRLGPALMQNIDDAVAFELARLEKAVQAARTNLGVPKWRRIHVVVLGGHMPRQDEHTMEYFSRILRQKQEGDKLIYLEGSAEEALALDLLATHELDRMIGRDFFGDPWRMHRDLLADGARKYFLHHPPKE